MKYLTLISVILLSFGSFSQEEKGLTIRYNFTYGNGDYSTGFESHQLQYGNNMDTFKIPIMSPLRKV